MPSKLNSSIAASAEKCFRSILWPDVQAQSRDFEVKNNAFEVKNNAFEVKNNDSSDLNPDTLYDLSLSQIIESLLAEYADYNLKEFFLRPLTAHASIVYRQQVMRDLLEAPTEACLREFASQMRSIRADLAIRAKIRHKLQQQLRLLEVLCRYTAALQNLAHSLVACTIASEGLRFFLIYLQDYIGAAEFKALEQEASVLKAELNAVRYSLKINGRRVQVSEYAEHPDFGGEIQKTFAKFQEAAGKRYRFEFHGTAEMNHVEAEILDRVARLHPAFFQSLQDFSSRHSKFIDDTLARFDREIHFYLAYVAYMRKVSIGQYTFCCPEITTSSKEVVALEAYNLALLDQQQREHHATTANSFKLSGAERIIVVTGPNQGGKTTFARMFGQLHYFAALGCYVPARSARLYLFDQIYTHFEREEKVENLASKLEADLERMQAILQSATPRSILIMNESLLATTLEDAIFLSQQVLEQVIAKDMLCLTVTFLDELSRYSDQTVSMVSEPAGSSNSDRKFKITRRPADGKAYAQTLAEKYGLSYEAILHRIEA